MVGANYMGGKRSTARAKSKDVVGRAQRRHFGKQRLASALCATQGNSLRQGSPSPAFSLPEITLAHARRHASTGSGTSPSRHAFSRDRLYPPTTSSYTSRNKPSHVLGALDTLDHTSMRAAIKRILRLPDLIGINMTDQPLRLACRPADGLLHLKDPDTQRSGTTAESIVDSSAGKSQADQHQPAPGNSITRYGPISPSPPDSSRTQNTTSINLFDDTGLAPTRVKAGYLETLGGCRDTSLGASVVHRLPCSSPFSSSSQSSGSLGLGLRTAPRNFTHFGGIGELSEEDFDDVDTSPSQSFRQPSRSHPIHQSSAESNEARLTTPSPGNENEVERLQTCRNDGRAIPSAGDDSRCSSLAGSGFNSTQNSTNQEATAQDALSNIPIDFLSDPHPWETIGRIMNLKPPETHVAQSTAICLTKNREGVDCVSSEKSETCYPRFPDAASSLRTRIDDTLEASAANPSTLDSGGLNDRRMMDTLNPPYTCNFIRSLCEAGLNQAEAHPHVIVRAQEALSIQVDEHASVPTATEPVVDVTFDGPCLFGDSDLEEDG